MRLAPIVLFAYSRLSNLKLTVESLRRNALAKRSELFIFSDGPTYGYERKVSAVRDYLREIKGFKKITITERESNVGLAENIISGVTEVVNKYGKVIVLEDDLILSPGFLKYMNTALSLYENDSRVLHVSGYMLPIDRRLPETFFYNQTSCWGWGTWKRAWKYFNPDAVDLLSRLEKANKISQLNIDDSYNFYSDLVANSEGRLRTWAIKWHATVVLKNGLCLHPGKSLVKNIGFDNDSQHGLPSVLQKSQLARTIHMQKIPLRESRKERGLVKDYFLKSDISPVIKSPLTNSRSVVIEKEIAVPYIVKLYRDSFDINVGKYFHGLPKIKLCRDIKSGYRFYFPLDLEGKDGLYKVLGRYAWYYMPDKWEYQQAMKFIASKDKVLEVGCGNGHFLEQLKKKKINSTGLEISQKAIALGKAKGLAMISQTIEKFSTSQRKRYDVVCLFQVLEHIVDVKNFLDCCLKVLKPGGKLIISVPNNESFIKFSDGVLNLPPHHMGLWDERSLANLSKLFPLKNETTLFEPLQTYHLDWYYGNILSRALLKTVRFIPKQLVIKFLNLFRNLIRGHSILVVFTKL